MQDEAFKGITVLVTAVTSIKFQLKMQIYECTLSNLFAHILPLTVCCKRIHWNKCQNKITAIVVWELKLKSPFIMINSQISKFKWLGHYLFIHAHTHTLTTYFCLLCGILSKDSYFWMRFENRCTWFDNTFHRIRCLNCIGMQWSWCFSLQ